MENYYEVLGVEPTASPEEIRAAYLELARKYHPDQNPSRIATRLMAQINRAYEVLRNPNLRADYDRKDGRGSPPRSEAGPPSSAPKQPPAPEEQRSGAPNAPASKKPVGRERDSSQAGKHAANR